MNNERKKNTILKMGKRNEQIKEYIPMTNKHMKKHPIPYVIREVQIKAKMSHLCIHISMIKI
jgi:hypothetical protein